MKFNNINLISYPLKFLKIWMDMILKMAELFFENFTFNLSNAYYFYTHVYFVYFENVNRFQFFLKDSNIIQFMLHTC